MIRRLLPALLLLAPLSACDHAQDRGPIDVSVIGTAPQVVDPSATVLTNADRVLMGAVAQGLVAFDGNGQIEPALATRWDVSDDGLYYTFRLDETRGLDAGRVVARLRAAVAKRSRNPLTPLLGAIAEIVPVTPHVIEIRLSAPRPNLLQLLAQPELAILTGKAAGSGPFAIASQSASAILLRRRTPEPDEGEEGPPPEEVQLRGERAGLAVARFASGSSSLVLGGSFADLAIARAAQLPAAQLRIDPAHGLFGLEILRSDGFLGEGANRRALAMAFDRDLLPRAFGLPGWNVAAALTPTGVEGVPAPARADWIVANPAERQARARALIAEWTRLNGIPTLRVALPPGSGSRLLLALLQAQWGAVGIVVSAAPDEEEADLRLIDEVAPADLASWYLRRFTCERSRICSEEADAALIAARVAPSLAERAAALAAADRIFAELTPFIPLATPLRWSLVSPSLDAYAVNPRAVHPLHHLRTPRD